MRSTEIPYRETFGDFLGKEGFTTDQMLKLNKVSAKMMKIILSI